MYKTLKGLALSLILVLTVTMSLSAQGAIEGGGGIIAIGSGDDPNTITAIASQTWTAGEAVYAIDAHNGVAWVYDDSQAAGAKWVQIGSGSVMGETDGTTIDFTVDGGGLITGEVILDTDAENDITSTNGLFLDAAVDGVTDTDNGIDVTINTTGDLLEVDLDIEELPDAGTVNANEDFVVIHQIATGDERRVPISDIQNPNQTLDLVTGADELQLNGTSGSGSTVNLSTRLVYYTDDTAATTGGVALEQEYKLDTGNPYGMPKGTIRIRQ